MRQSSPCGRARTALGIRITLALMASTAIISASGFPLPARAQQASAPYSVPAGPLGTAITRFGEHSGLQILYPADLVRGKQSPGVLGSLTPNEALARLLAGSDLTFRYTAANTVTLAPAGRPVLSTAQDATRGDDAIVLETIALTAEAATTTEGSNSWTTEWMRSATGLILDQKQTPQSTSALTYSQIKDRNITTIAEAMDAATGVTVQAYESDRINYYARGFQIDAYQYDGVPVPRDGVWQFGDNNPDMALYDHIEIVRGASGLMQGAGEPGASINFIRKRPTDTFQGSIATTLAYPQGGRVEGDVSGPLNASGSLRGRLVGVADGRNGTLDRYHKDKYAVYGALEYDLSDTTLLSAGLSYQKTNGDGVTWGGLQPFYADGGLIDWGKGASVGADWTYIDTERTEFFTALEHKFDNGWAGRLVYTHVQNDMDATLAWIYGTPDRETGDGLHGYGTRYDGGYKQDNLNAILTGDYELFGRSHQFVLGAMASKGSGTYYGYGSGDTFDVNMYAMNGNYPAPVLSETSTFTSASSARQYGIYGTTRISLTDRLNVLAGARINWWDGDEGDGTSTTADYRFSGEVTPYIGFTYDITPVYTAYGSIASIYKPALVRDAAGQYLDPTYGWNYELGVKADLMNGQLMASAAIFQTDQKDVASYVDWIPEENRSIYESIDGTKTRGFEVEVAGAVNERWNISAGYTYRTSEDVDGNPIYRDQPKNTLKIATDYRPALLDDRLRIGGAVRLQSGTDSMDFANDDTEPSVHQGGYAVFDLNTIYQVNDQLEVSLSVNNIFDKKYYATTGFYDTVVYGESRTAELVLRAKF